MNEQEIDVADRKRAEAMLIVRASDRLAAQSNPDFQDCDHNYCDAEPMSGFEIGQYSVERCRICRAGRLVAAFPPGNPFGLKPRYTSDWGPGWSQMRREIAAMDIGGQILSDAARNHAPRPVAGL